MTSSYYRYYVNDIEVTKEKYVSAEREAGFRNTMNQPDEPATNSFSDSVTGLYGRYEYVRVVDGREEWTLR